MVETTKKLGLVLKPDSLVDGRYSHKEYVDAHLELMMFLLEKDEINIETGVLVLKLNTVTDIMTPLNNFKTDDKNVSGHLGMVGVVEVHDWDPSYKAIGRVTIEKIINKTDVYSNKLPNGP